MQLTQKINIAESTLTSRIDGFQNEMAQNFDTLQCSISRLTNQLQVQEKGKFPSQTQPNPRGIHEIASANEPTPRMDEVKAIITLRSGKKVEYMNKNGHLGPYINTHQEYTNYIP